MKDLITNTANTSSGSNDEAPRKFNIAGGQDLPDTPKDLEKMQPETVVFDLPDVEDIPGQENVKPMPFGELADTTISSDDEEGVGLFDDEGEDDDELAIDNSSNVNNDEKKTLQQAEEDMPTEDNTNLRKSALDNEDEDGTPLNVEGFGKDVTGSDLDIPGSEEDDANEELGEEDEENNSYSGSNENNDNK